MSDLSPLSGVKQKSNFGASGPLMTPTETLAQKPTEGTYWPIKFLFIDAVRTTPGANGVKVQKEKLRQIAQGAM